MEKIKIIKVEDSGKKYQEKVIWNVTFEKSGTTLKASCFNEKIKEYEGKEADFEIKESEYKGAKQYCINFPQEKKAFPAKDYKFEKRKVSLENAVKFSEKLTLKSSEVIQIAESFYTYLNS